MKRLALLSAAAVTAAIAGGVVLAGTGGAQQPGPPTGTLELVSLDRESNFNFVDNPPKARRDDDASPGDLLAVNGRLRDASNRPTGRFHAAFTVTQARPFTGQGSGTFDVGTGQIVVVGRIDDRGRRDRSDTLAVVGGSGAYTAARGTMVTTETPRSTRFTFTFSG